ncbi:aldo/keto reductase [Pseudomonas oryzihabitans]|uniref:aldo/keto reductase n=1 Tax=Pseudomonas oryzihabitans TaxID=47885 RepID=UPI00123C0974|nr:aldo/keto reductase [Pseudomonas oryzihabitans]QEU01847.1 aldo/keto reductase [Pseudomonas oryzihabitans]
MKYVPLGNSDLIVPVLSLGTATFGGGNEFYKKWGATDAKEATELVSVALDAGCNLLDTADAYSSGLSEEILGKAIAGRREKVILATKTGMRMGPGDENIGTSGERIIRACAASLRRLGTEHIDLYQLHAFDAQTPVEEMLRALDRLLAEGKIGQYGVSNFSGWHLMKMVGLADQHQLPRPVSHQVYYSLVDREFEWELMPLALDQDVSSLIWSPLAGAKLTGKLGRNKLAPEGSRAATNASMTTDLERLYTITDELESLSKETGHSIAQLSIAWLLSRPSVGSVVIGARNADQLRDNLVASSIRLDFDHIARLDAASARRPIYPYWHQSAVYSERNPAPVPVTLNY